MARILNRGWQLGCTRLNVVCELACCSPIMLRAVEPGWVRCRRGWRRGV